MGNLNLFLKKCLYKILEPDLDRSSNIRFIHQKPKFGNIGDELCSPKHYFNFKAKERINILGGGVQDSFYINKVQVLGLKYNQSILWGVGQSIKYSMTPHFINKLPFAFWGLRDIDSTHQENFLPCVSCLHPMLDLPQTDSKTLIFLNFDKKLTDKNIQTALQEKFGHYTILYNNCSIKEFIQHFQSCNKIITNSFHGAYWGLLAGKRVSLIGCYSSKFYSLYKMFQLDPETIIKVNCDNNLELLNAIEIAIKNDQWQRLANPHKVKVQFKSINLSFVSQLRQSGLFESIELRDRNSYRYE